MRFYEMPFYLTVGLSVAITFGFLFLFPYDDKDEWAQEEIKIRREKRESRSEEERNARRETISNYLASDATNLQQIKLDQVDYPSAWLNTSFDRVLEAKSMQLMKMLNKEVTQDRSYESNLIEEGLIVSQNLKLRNERNKEIDLLQYLLSSSGYRLDDLESINTQLKQDLLNNNNLREDLQLGVQSSSPSNPLIYDKLFFDNFNSVLEKRVASGDLKKIGNLI